MTRGRDHRAASLLRLHGQRVHVTSDDPGGATLAASLGLTFDRPGGVVGGHTRFISRRRRRIFMSRYGLTKVESGAVSMAAVQPGAFAASLQGPGGIFFPAATSKHGFITVGMDAGGNGSLWMANNVQAAYRFTICRLGANKELIESAPSDRAICLNTLGAPRTPAVFFNNTWMLPPDAFLRIYRSKTVASGLDPSDELYLIAELFPGGSPDASGFLSPLFEPAGFPGTPGIALDNTPDTSLYAPLYTNAISGSGSAAAFYPAPLAADMAYFKNRLLLLNTTDVHRLTVKVIGTGAGGILDGDRITIDGVILRFNLLATTSAYAGPTTDVGLFTSGTVAQNIENTARALANVINFQFKNNPRGIPGTLVARYISLTATDAGQVLIQRIVPGAQSFALSTNSAAGGARTTRPESPPIRTRSRPECRGASQASRKPSRCATPRSWEMPLRQGSGSLP
jgi:hypothetical protein